MGGKARKAKGTDKTLSPRLNKSAKLIRLLAVMRLPGTFCHLKISEDRPKA